MTESELDFCAAWVRDGDLVGAVRAGSLFKLGKDPIVLGENMLERPEIQFIISVMRRVLTGIDDVDIDIDNERENKARIAGDLRKVGRSAAKQREHGDAIRALEMEGKVLGVITEKRDISVSAVMKEPSKLTLSEMRRLLEHEMVDVTPGSV